MYCPRCQAEYRPGFSVCAHCQVDLVDTLPESDEIQPDELESTRPVGRATSSEIARPIEVEGRVLDLLRIFPLPVATEIRDFLTERGFPVVLVPIQGVDFPDQQARLEVRVREKDHEAAEAALREAWSSQVEAEGILDDAQPLDAEHCPACGAEVAADVEECPDCGLFIGALE